MPGGNLGRGVNAPFLGVLMNAGLVAARYAAAEHLYPVQVREVVTMPHRSALVAAVLLATLMPMDGEATTRMSVAIAKSFHPESARDYSTTHPALGATGPLVGEWLRWRAGLVRHSHSRVGPFAGIAVAWRVTGSWRVGLSAGIVGNYSRGRWVRRGVVPIVQWEDRARDLVWEFGLARAQSVTFVGLSVQMPISVLARN